MIYAYIEGLIEQAIHAELINSMDKTYTRNQVMKLLHLETYPDPSVPAQKLPIPNLLDDLVAYAVEHKVIDDIFSDKEILAAEIMNCFIAHPSTINNIFYKKYDESPKKATDYFYELCMKSNYIQMERIKKNISYPVETPYGKMDITINLSKPEKDPEQIKRERETKTAIAYPKCRLCIENEGYPGRIDHPARSNHRMIRVPLCNETWFFQYSPYVYYNEHSILLSEEHRDMKIDSNTFKRLLAFTDKFPHYFIGSNADLPIVGGSILSHDHYQAGRYEFAMTNAQVAYTFQLKLLPQVKSSVLHWPLSVIRLQGKKTDDVVKVAEHILDTWKNYSDETANILAYTDDMSHNTITPIARKRNALYELDLVLRNNRTTGEYPQGIFHPHQDVHHIKKENIGLIEVMGLAVLPARLKDELAQIKNYLLGKQHELAAYHKTWAKQLKSKYGNVKSKEMAEDIVQKEVGKKFVRILQDAGVFKNSTAFARFIDVLNK